VWGAFKLNAKVLRELYALWCEPGRGDPYIGTLVNAWLARGGQAWAAHDGTAYVDVATLHGWRDAVHLLERRPAEQFPRPYRSVTAVRDEGPVPTFRHTTERNLREADDAGR
jgi:hypothetical protein